MDSFTYLLLDKQAIPHYRDLQYICMERCRCCFFGIGGSAVKINKILNNNVVIAKDDNGHEVIVMSTGLGFSKKAGDIFRREDAQKILSTITASFHISNVC